MNGVEVTLHSACEAIPGVVAGALVLVPEGLLIGGVGRGGALDREPLVRSAARLATERAPLITLGASSPFVEYAFVSDDQFVVIVRGRRQPRVSLALACRREANLALVLSSTRRALSFIETTVDLSPWEV